MRGSITRETPSQAATSTAPATKRRSRREHRTLIAVSRAITDFILINAGFYFAWWLRYETTIGPDVADYNVVGWDAYMPLQLALGVLLMIIFFFNGHYRHRVGVSWFDEVMNIGAGSVVGIAIMIVAYFYYRPLAMSRLMFVYALVLIVVLLACSRLVEHIVRAILRRRGIGLERVMVVGTGSLGKLMLQSIMVRPDLGFNVIGFVDDERTEDIGRFKALGKLSDIVHLIAEHDLDQVIIALPSAQHREVNDILGKCRTQGVKFRIVPDFYELSLRHVDISDINGVPLIGLKDMRMRRRALIIKRGMDVLFSLAILTVTSPIILFIALAIKLDSSGPIIFRQVRVGRGGRLFLAYKFRSMKQNAEAELEKLRQFNEVDGPIFKMRDDPRITRVGHWLRRTSLDELPQFFNILNGDMSFVGPRPPIPAEVENYEDWHRKRLDARPGLTGLWQVSGRSNLGFEEMVLLDLYYIENWSLALDFKIILKTIPAVLSAAGAY